MLIIQRATQEPREYYESRNSPYLCRGDDYVRLVWHYIYRWQYAVCDEGGRVLEVSSVLHGSAAYSGYCWACRAVPQALQSDGRERLRTVQAKYGRGPLRSAPFRCCFTMLFHMDGGGWGSGWREGRVFMRPPLPSGGQKRRQLLRRVGRHLPHSPTRASHPRHRARSCG